MRYMSMIKLNENAGQAPPALFEAIAALGEEATKAGVLVEQGGLLPSAMGARVRLAGGRISVNDGPFTDGKEVVGGYAVFDVPSKQEALDWATRFMEAHKQHWPGFEGEAEVRQMFESPA